MNVLIVFVVSDWVYICALVYHAKIGRLEKEQHSHEAAVQSMN